MSEPLPVTVPDLIEIKPDEHGVPRMWIDGELFPYGTVGGYEVGVISRKEMPSVTVSITAFRVTADHGFPRHPAHVPLAVIAGSYAEYREWCRGQDLDPHAGNVFYATLETLQGRSRVDVRRTGTWQDRDDLAELEAVLRVVNRTA